jgi:hypothetical protein
VLGLAELDSDGTPGVMDGQLGPWYPVVAGECGELSAE